MKFKLGITLLALRIATQLNAKTLPIMSFERIDNFGPDTKHNFEVYPDLFYLENNVDPEAAAVKFLDQMTTFKIEVFKTSSHTVAHNGVTHLYYQQIVNGLSVVNAVANVNVGRNGQILSCGNSFFLGPTPERSNSFRPRHTSDEARHAVANLLKTENVQESNENPPKLKYIPDNEGQNLLLAWDIVAETEHNMYNAIVLVDTDEVLQLIDWVSHSTYTVYPLGTNDPSLGERKMLSNPEHNQASPLGWHKINQNETFHTTRGNNVYAQENHDGNSEYLNKYRPDGGAQLVFDHPIDFTKEPKDFVDAAITNLFYWTNAIHDLFYVYGFNEKSGNFQENNFGLGGEGGDAVVANAQDGNDRNNAFFQTPPDGQHGRMKMHVWTRTSPARDSALDGGIIMHEYLHGISTRLTGGSKDVSCLAFGESRGMGEGWGDLFATITRVNVNSTRQDSYTMGAYVQGNNQGIRNYPYSTNIIINPSTYSYTTRPEYNFSHAKGEVWASILFEVFWNLVEKHGFDPDWLNNNAKDIKTEGNFQSFLTGENLIRRNVGGKLGGNIVMVQLLVDAMKIQPCRPNFLNARDAIIQADKLNNGGENSCQLWNGFGKRGLGTGAIYPGRESFDVPLECK